jgi:hypothetical protein
MTREEQSETSRELSMAWLYLYQREKGSEAAAKVLFAISDDPVYIERRIWTAGRLKGEQLTLRANIIAVVKHRFGTVGAAELSPRIEALTETSDLQPLFLRALTCANCDELRAALPNRQKG